VTSAKDAKRQTVVDLTAARFLRASFFLLTTLRPVAIMSLQSLYQSFLVDPSAAALADAASFNYITTLTTINEAASIVKHLATQNKQLKKKQEKVIGCIESSDAVCLDVETTLEFITSGGAYLPGLDDNFVVDRVVTFPIVSVCVQYLESSTDALFL